MSQTIQLIAVGLRTLASLAPALFQGGHGDRITKTMNTLATLSERGDEAFKDLRALVAKLTDMEGVDRHEQEALWAEIESTSSAIQEAVADLRKPAEDPPPPAEDPPPPPPPAAEDPPPPPAGGEEGGGNSGGGAGGSGEAEKT